MAEGLLLVALGAILGAGLAFIGQWFLTWWRLREERIGATRAVFYEAWQNSVVLVQRRDSRRPIGQFSSATYLALLPHLTRHLSDEAMDDVANAFSMLPVVEQTMAASTNVQGLIVIRGDRAGLWEEWVRSWQKAYRALLVAGFGTGDAKADAMTWDESPAQSAREPE